MTPWEVLGLEEDNLDQREIRRAYAREIRIYKPDKFPEEFRERRDAYEYLMQLAKTPDQGIAHAEVENHLGKESVAEPEPIVEHSSRPDSELGTGPTAEKINLDPEKEIPKACEQFLSGEINVNDWKRIIVAQSEGDVDLLVPHIGEVEIFKELDCNSTDISRLIIQNRALHGEYALLSELAEQWIQVIDRTALIDAGPFTLWFMTKLALVRVEIARRLYDSAYEYLGTAQNDYYANLYAERYLNAGAELEYLSDELKRFYAQLIESGEWDGVTETGRAGRAIEQMSRIHGDSEIRHLLEESTPNFVEKCDEFYRTVDHVRKWNDSLDGAASVSLAHNNEFPVYRSPTGDTKDPIEIPWYCWWIVIFILFRVVSYYSNKPSYVPPKIDIQQFQQELNRQNVDSEAFDRLLEQGRKQGKSTRDTLNDMWSDGSIEKALNEEHMHRKPAPKNPGP